MYRVRPAVRVSAGAVAGQFHRLAGQLSGDGGQQAARGQHGAGLAHVGVDAGPRGGLVVERGHLHAAVGAGGDFQAAQDRVGRPGGQRPGGELDRGGQRARFGGQLS